MRVLVRSRPPRRRTLAEASIIPELSRALAALHRLAACIPQGDDAPARKKSLAALAELVDALPAVHSPRVSLLRWSLLRIHQALRLLSEAPSLSDITGLKGARFSVGELSEAALALAQLVAGARRRLSPTAQIGSPQIARVVIEVGAAVDHAVATRDAEHLREPLEVLRETAESELPDFFAALVMRVMGAVQRLPIARSRPPSSRSRLAHKISDPPLVRSLPDWLPLSRILGGFYVLSAIAVGGTGSVFVARRAEQRGDAEAQTFALKVPEYDGTVSQLLSEADFLQLFREEASALLALPDASPNLARFVTFDAGVRPKPICDGARARPQLEKLRPPPLDRSRVSDRAGSGEGSLRASRRARAPTSSVRTFRAHLETRPRPGLVDFGLEEATVDPAAPRG